MIKQVICLTALVALLTSCGEKGWTDEHEKTFNDNCIEGFNKGFFGKVEESAIADREAFDGVVKDMCSCAFEAIKEDHEDPSELDMDKMDYEKYYEGCLDMEALMETTQSFQ